MDLLFEHISVAINNHEILHNISGHAGRGEVMSIMGPSGAGKTTLLNVLAGRCYYTKGKITINGENVENTTLRRKIAYVPQKDVFFPNLKLKENLMYTALLVLPNSMSYKTKESKVDEIISLLQLNHCENTVMGDEVTSGYGLSGGERKRAGIACKLLASPLVLLLDEPTTGLDATTAFSIVKIIKNIASVGKKTIIMSIHQPAGRIFELLNGNLVLMASGGKLVYSGKVSDVLAFFAEINLHCPAHFNPADFILDMISRDSDKYKEICIHAGLADEETVNRSDRDNTRNGWSKTETTQQNTGVFRYIKDGEDSYIKDADESYQKGRELVLQVDSVEKRGSSINRTNSKVSQQQRLSSKNNEFKFQWSTSFFTQLLILTKRSLKQSIFRMFRIMNIVLLLGLTVVSSAAWFQMSYSENNLRSVRGMFHYVSMESIFMVNQFGVSAFHRYRSITNAERQDSMYRTSSFFISTLLAETIVDCTPVILLYTIVYWSVGLGSKLWVFISSMAIFLLGVIVGHNIGVLIGALFAVDSIAMDVSIFYTVFNFGATDIIITNWPWFMEWLKYAAFRKYMTSALTKLEFGYGNVVTCDPQDTQFREWCSHGNTSNGHNTTIIPAAAVLESFSYTTPMWLDILILVIVLIVVWIATYVALRVVNRPGKVNKKL